MRILALDWGTVRIGVAVSDPDGKIAFPLDHFFESSRAIAEIKEIVAQKEISKIIIGYPKSLSGDKNESTEQVGKFVSKLQAQIACPIEYVDERLSSVGAKKTLSGMGINQKDQRDLVDNLAAQQMLQQYLEKKNK